jgi:hypothetical protein
MNTAAATLGELKRKSKGPRNQNSDEDPEALNIDKKLTQELLSAASRQYIEAVGATYELL